MKNDKTIPEEDIEHERVCFTCSDDIERWVKGIIARGEAYRYDFLGWPGDLWNRTAAEALDYITMRFRETTDAREYYCCMLYLTKKFNAEELFVLWTDSPNFRAIREQQSRENGQEGMNTLPKKTTAILGRREPYRGLVRCVGYGGRHVRV